MVVILVSAVLIFSAVPASWAQSAAGLSGTFNYYGPAFIQLTFANGTNLVQQSDSPINSEVDFSFSTPIPSTVTARSVVSLVVKPYVKCCLVNETFNIGVNSSTMELTYGNQSLGYYYLWLPGLVANGSTIERFLTVIDMRNDTQVVPGQVIQRGGFDYVVAKEDDPYISIVNVYNASTGAAIALMIPGRLQFTIEQIESGNFTEGHTNIAFSPLGLLLNLNWFDFEPGFSGLLISSNYEAKLSVLLGTVVPQMDMASTSVAPAAFPVAIGLEVATAATVIVVILASIWLKASRDQKNRRSRVGRSGLGRWT